MLTKYHKILGIPLRASESEIKAAYRKKARLYHPDVSKLPDAEEKFIEANEAYEYLLRRKTGKVYSDTKRTYQKPKERAKTYAEWKEEEREKARQRARKHARMKYEAFKKTNYYKNEIALEIIGDNFMFYSFLAACIVPPIFGLSRGSYVGFYFTIFFGLAGIQIWNGALKKESNIRISLLSSSVLRILKTKVFSLFAMIAINLLIFLKIVMHTLIPLEWTFSFLVLSILGGYMLVKFHPKIKKHAYNRTLFAFVIVPFAYQFLFVVNFFLSGNPVTETYRYKLVMTKTYSRRHNKPRWDESPILKLENDTYQEYLGIRLLWSPEQMRLGHIVEYHFEEGLFGVRVLKGYEIL